jgi:hypothetical protein
MLLPHGRRRAKIRVAGYAEQEIDLETSQDTTKLNVEMMPVSGIPVQPGKIQFATSNTNVDENVGTITILVERTEGYDGAVSISYTINNGSAIVYDDYDNVGGTLNWLDKDERAKAINLPIIDDEDFEGDKTLTITLSNPTNGAILGTFSKITVTIIDDEAAF